MRKSEGENSMKFVKLTDPVYDLDDNITTINELDEKGLISFEKWIDDSTGRNTYVAVFKGTDEGWRISYQAYKSKIKK